MFDFNRFIRLARAQVAEQWRSWAWFLGIGVIVHFVVVMLQLATWSGHRNLGHEFQTFMYCAGLFVTGPIFAARYFQGMSRRESAAVILMRPASAFEKWLLALGVILLAYPLAYALAFQICNVPAALYAQAAMRAEWDDPSVATMIQHLDLAKFGVLMPWEIFDDWREVIGVLLWLAALQGFALLGSVYFRVMPFILTIVTGFVLLLLLILLVGVSGSNPDAMLGWWTEPPSGEPWYQVAATLAWLLVPGLVWLAALFALREREVA